MVKNPRNPKELQVDHKNEKPTSGSSENHLKKTGPQMYEDETKNLRFINIEAEHQFLLKLQENDLDAVEEWLEKYPDGIEFSK